MMLDVGGGPVQSRSLEGHRTADQEKSADPVGGLETLVGQHPVIADRDAEGAQNVADQKQGEIDGGDETAPEADNRINGAQQGNPNNELKDHLIGRGNWLGQHKPIN